MLLGWRRDEGRNLFIGWRFLFVEKTLLLDINVALVRRRVVLRTPTKVSNSEKEYAERRHGLLNAEKEGVERQQSYRTPEKEHVADANNKSVCVCVRVGFGGTSSIAGGSTFFFF